METQKVLVGTTESGSGGIVADRTRAVEFEAAMLATVTDYGTGRDGGVIDSRGTDETLYQTPDERLIVAVRDWSHWQGEPTVHTLHEVTKDDLDVTGRFSALGTLAGYGRSLTLDEALAPEGELEWDGEGL